MKPASLILSLAAVIVLSTVVVSAQDAPHTVLDKAKVKYSPYPEEHFPNQVFFGDTHLHTSYSTDAGMIGCTLGPEDAYRFSRGETVTSSTERSLLPATLGPTIFSSSPTIRRTSRLAHGFLDGRTMASTATAFMATVASSRPSRLERCSLGVLASALRVP